MIYKIIYNLATLVQWTDLKNKTPWTVTKKNLMQERLMRMVRGNITDVNGTAITATPV